MGGQRARRRAAARAGRRLRTGICAAPARARVVPEGRERGIEVVWGLLRPQVGPERPTPRAAGHPVGSGRGERRRAVPRCAQRLLARKSVVWGKSVYGSVDLGCRRYMKKNTNYKKS